MVRGNVENGGKVIGNKKHTKWAQNRQGKVKNSIGNGEAKELICTTQGHELRAVSYTHLTLPTRIYPCRSRWSPYH